MRPRNGRASHPELAQTAARSSLRQTALNGLGSSPPIRFMQLLRIRLTAWSSTSPSNRKSFEKERVVFGGYRQSSTAQSVRHCLASQCYLPQTLRLSDISSSGGGERCFLCSFQEPMSWSPAIRCYLMLFRQGWRAPDSNEEVK